MSREKLREAIDLLRLSRKETPVDDLWPHVRIVLAAARAYACETCRGCGKVMIGRHLTYCADGTRESGPPIYKDCPDCLDFRRIADGGEE